MKFISLSAMILKVESADQLISITWELVRRADSLTPQRLIKLEILEVGPLQSLNSSEGDSGVC